MVGLEALAEDTAGIAYNDERTVVDGADNGANPVDLTVAHGTHDYITLGAGIAAAAADDCGAAVDLFNNGAVDRIGSGCDDEQLTAGIHAVQPDRSCLQHHFR